MNRFSIYFSCATFLLLSCATARREGPPLVDYGRTECARCGMIVSEERFASGYISEQNQDVVFDDFGEFFKDIRDDTANYSKLYVQDMEGSGWVRAVDAFYVRVPGLVTPMGSGVVAFRDKEMASRFASNKEVKDIFNFESALKAF